MSKRIKATDDGILVATDDPQLQRLLKSISEADGRQVLRAAGVAATIQMQEYHPQLVVFDLDVSSSSNAITEIRHLSDVPVVALSSLRAEADLVNALDLGADDYVQKPFRIAELLARLRSVLQHRFRGRDEEPVFCFGPL